MRYIKTDWYQWLAPVKFWYQWHDTYASLRVQVDWHRLLVPENWSVCMAVYCCCDGQLDSADDIKKAQDQLNKQLFDMDSNLQRIAAPNMKAIEK